MRRNCHCRVATVTQALSDGLEYLAEQMANYKGMEFAAE
jgi:hypothetical protein